MVVVRAIIAVMVVVGEVMVVVGVVVWEVTVLIVVWCEGARLY